MRWVWGVRYNVCVRARRDDVHGIFVCMRVFVGSSIVQRVGCMIAWDVYLLCAACVLPSSVRGALAKTKFGGPPERHPRQLSIDTAQLRGRVFARYTICSCFMQNAVLRTKSFEFL